MKKINIVLILILLAGLLHAQNPLVKQWDSDFGGTHEDFMFSFQQTSDGGYILGGHSNSIISGNKTQDNIGGYDYWIVKIDSLGNKQWDKVIGGDGDDLLNVIRQTKDGGYILGGASNSGVSGDKTQPDWDTTNVTSDYWVVKLDSLGNKQWDKDFGGTENDFIFSLQQTSDNGYILGGSSFSGISGDKTQDSWGGYDYWVVKIDSLGNKQWDKDLGGVDDDQLTTVTQTVDGGFLVGGETGSDTSGDKTQPTKGQIDYWIIKTDSAGNIKWDKDFGGTGNDVLYSLDYTTDRGFILAGTSASGIGGDKTEANWDPSNSSYDYWVVKTDSLGNKQWDKDFGGDGLESQLGNISQTLDGGYLIAGTSYSNASGNKTEDNLASEQNWIVKTDASGILQWDKTIFTTAADESGFAIQSRDGCYLVANYTSGVVGGYKTSEGFGFNDFWIVKFCDSTLATGINSTISFTSSLNVYPNPSKGEIIVTIPGQDLGKISISIYDVLGKVVFTSEENQSASTYTKRINLHDLPNGIYFLNAIIDGQSVVKKIVKE